MTDRARLVSVYLYRRDGASWFEVARTHGWRTETAALIACRSLAREVGLTWPIQVNKVVSL